MSATSTRTIALAFSGDRVANPSAPAAANTSSPAAIGDNTITVPTGGTVPTAATIVKPAGNAATIKLKGAGGDTGITLHPTDPDSISLASSQASFILNASATVTGVVVIWS